MRVNEQRRKKSRTIAVTRGGGMEEMADNREPNCFKKNEAKRRGWRATERRKGRGEKT